MYSQLEDSFIIFHLYSYLWPLLKNIAVADIDFHFFNVLSLD